MISRKQSDLDERLASQELLIASLKVDLDEMRQELSGVKARGEEVRLQQTRGPARLKQQFWARMEKHFRVLPA
ncbi:MAG: hypothetical protein V3R94_06890 [Acidobacteriota bacterium]